MNRDVFLSVIAIHSILGTAVNHPDSKPSGVLSERLKADCPLTVPARYKRADC